MVVDDVQDDARRPSACARSTKRRRSSGRPYSTRGREEIDAVVTPPAAPRRTPRSASSPMQVTPSPFQPRQLASAAAHVPSGVKVPTCSSLDLRMLMPCQASCVRRTLRGATTSDRPCGPSGCYATPGQDSRTPRHQPERVHGAGPGAGTVPVKVFPVTGRRQPLVSVADRLGRAIAAAPTRGSEALGRELRRRRHVFQLQPQHRS